MTGINQWIGYMVLLLGSGSQGAAVTGYGGPSFPTTRLLSHSSRNLMTIDLPI